MPKNTGRGSRSAHPGHGRSGEWLDGAAQKPLEVWAEPEGVVIYEGEKITATRRTVLTPEEADDLARLLRDTAANVRRGV
jgi:hypothetical protein